MSVQESKKTEGSRQAFLLHLLLMSLWGVQLLYSDAYYVNYVLLLITGICFYINTQSEEGICGKSREKRADTIIKIFGIA